MYLEIWILNTSEHICLLETLKLTVTFFQINFPNLERGKADI